MPYITTFWNYDLQPPNESFKVMGEKGYTNTTDVILNETSTARGKTLLEYFTIEFSVEVLRDKGASKVTFYDNGTPIPCYDGNNIIKTMLDWTDQTSTQTVKLRLGYNTAHKIQARYYGNSNGLPSRSKIIDVFEEMPNLFKTTLERTTSTTVFESTVTLPIKFTSGSTIYSENKVIKCYVDGTYTTQATITTSSGVGTGTISLSSLNNGLHRISLLFEGDTHNELAKLDFDVSVGYQVHINAQESSLLVGTTNSYPVTVKDYFDNPISNKQVSVSWESGSSMMTSYGSGWSNATTNSNGEVTITGGLEAYQSLPASAGLRVVCGGSYSNTVTLHADEITDITLVPARAITTPNTPVSIDGTVTTATNYRVIPLNAERTEFTDSDGKFTRTIQPTTTSGNYTYTENIQGYTGQCTVETAKQYWSSQNGSLDKKYKIIGNNFMELSNGFKLEVPSANALSLIGMGSGLETLNDWDIEFDVISSSKPITFLYYEWEFDEGVILHSNSGTIVQKSLTLNPQDKVQLIRNNNTFKIKVNNTEQYSTTFATIHNPCFGITSSTAKNYLTFDNLKFHVR